jgi:hypothetical protein
MKMQNWSKKILWFVLGAVTTGFISFISASHAQNQFVKLVMKIGEERVLDDGLKVGLSKGDGDFIVVTLSRKEPEKSDSSKLIGTWEAEITESGYPQKITWQVNADGTSNAWISSIYGTRVLGTPGSRWSYSDGVIFGEGSSARVTWIDNNHIVLTIIQNGDGPSARGRTRHYYRVIR